MTDPEATLVRRLIREGAAHECDGCDSSTDDLWHPDGLPRVYWHGYGDEIQECESGIMVDAIEGGLIEVPTHPRCEKGHDWYGDGCPECEAAHE